VFPAAGKAGDCAAHAADSGELLTTIRTAIDESRGVSSRRKGQIVTALLVGNFQVAAGLPPLVSMWRDPSPAGAKLRQDMRQLMP